MSGQSEIADTNVILVVNKDIFRFEVTMDYGRRMDVR
jgi:hypothetical protein